MPSVFIAPWWLAAALIITEEQWILGEDGLVRMDPLELFFFRGWKDTCVGALKWDRPKPRPFKCSPRRMSPIN
ncbi:unnamed protein product [Pleuronectes platessa]|uniref:Uncharacterized protein n=1 Tax=Pleuronectes platessa TaxID=8262 RepID=A0A9N7UKW0_PLEPL|nr:unnamed protein product [Pleuronectes platessa]